MISIGKKEEKGLSGAFDFNAISNNLIGTLPSVFSLITGDANKADRQQGREIELQKTSILANADTKKVIAIAGSLTALSAVVAMFFIFKKR